MTTISRIAAACLCVLLASSPAAAQFHQGPQGYHPQASPYPFAHGPAVDWMAPQHSNFDYGGTECGPHWYDAYVEAVYLTRESSNNRDLMTDGILGPVVLSTDSADFDWEAGVRFGVRYQLSAVTSVEGTYLDALTFSGHDIATSGSDGLFSLYSDFGTMPFGGFPSTTDQASLATVSNQSDLDVVEINWRRDWITPSYRISGSWLLGLRYSKLDERLQFTTLVLPHFDPIGMIPVPGGSSSNDVRAFNEMVGPQIGTHLTTCIRPGLLLEGKIKAGVLLDIARQTTSFQTNPEVGPGLIQNEAADDDDVAFVTEAGVQLVFQIHPLWKIRGGYEMLFMNGIATASGNLNGQPPPRPVDIDMNGEAFYHGATLGLELGW